MPGRGAMSDPLRSEPRFMVLMMNLRFVRFVVVRPC
jgi:hypothetical protein